MFPWLSDISSLSIPLIFLFRLLNSLRIANFKQSVLHLDTINFHPAIGLFCFLIIEHDWTIIKSLVIHNGSLFSVNDIYESFWSLQTANILLLSKLFEVTLHTQTLMLVTEETHKVKTLSAPDAIETVGQVLQLLQHWIFGIVVKHGFINAKAIFPVILVISNLAYWTAMGEVDWVLGRELGDIVLVLLLLGWPSSFKQLGLLYIWAQTSLLESANCILVASNWTLEVLFKATLHIMRWSERICWHKSTTLNPRYVHCAIIPILWRPNLALQDGKLLMNFINIVFNGDFIFCLS